MLRFRLAATRLVRPLVIAAVGVGGVVIAPATSSAAVPDHGTFSSHNDFSDTNLCDFLVSGTEDEAGTFTVFFDSTGAVTSLVIHFKYHAIISANGHTIVEDDTWTEFHYADGDIRATGNTVHIQGDGPPGLVQLDAGEIIYNAADGSLTIHGPHPQFAGQTWCFALVP